jgi:hypothetical protein
MKQHLLDIGFSNFRQRCVRTVDTTARLDFLTQWENTRWAKGAVVAGSRYERARRDGAHRRPRRAEDVLAACLDRTRARRSAT